MERLERELRRSLGSAGVPDAGALSTVVRVWADAVGPAIARAAWPARISRDGTLHVATTSATWAFELGSLAERIREQLGALAGDDTPAAIRFAPGPVPEHGAVAPLPPAATRPSPSDEDLREATELARTVEDEKLRELIRRAAAASLAGPPRDRLV